MHRLMERGARSFLDVGGGARPSLRLARIRELGLGYVVMDVSAAELARTPEGYRTFEGDVLDRRSVEDLLAAGGPFDVVVSRWTAEHMSDGGRFHRNVFALLRPGGTAVHLFPTLYALPFLFNRVVDSRTALRVLSAAQPARRAKFAAYYSWCRGPSRRQLARLESVGYDIDAYIGFFGHYYYRRVAPLWALQRRLVPLAVDHPVALATSFALAVLKRPGAG